ncbi:M24 family metallopeptidase [Bosea lathyri]|uniref:Xaa-Pro aminopeptidase n=1 Tax=Bosea lathyri TaxID=1036778 RepID=A0A1H6CAU6_9HYPH|nr:Xaa-Pro peptidase family protein [Bosea lathyri]SEG70018.1 Xaa-Pro aminopeptidase [Bosea lathyri]
MAQMELKFSRAEFERRLRICAEIMLAENLDLMVLDEIESMLWTSGFGISQTLWRCVVIPRDGDPFLVVRCLDEVPALERTHFSEIIGFRDWDDPISVLGGELRKRKLDTAAVGIEFDSQSMSPRRLEDLRKELPGATFVDLGDRFWRERAVKSGEEIQYHRQAASICDQALAHGVAVVRVGARQRDVVAAASQTFMELGADQGFVGLVTSGVGWGALHGNEHSNPIEPGSIVHIELVPSVNGYSSRIMRSVSVGDPTPRQLDVMSQMIAIQDKQLSEMGPGVEAKVIDALAREPMIKTGLRPRYDNITGYTLGCFPNTTQKVSEFVHNFTPVAEWKLKEGMTLHMYLSAEGLAISESIVVRGGGIERLTQTERKLFVAS